MIELHAGIRLLELESEFSPFDPSSANDISFLTDYFIGNIHIRIDDHDLTPPTASHGVVGTAIQLLRLVRFLPSDQRTHLPFIGSADELHLRMGEGNNVLLTATYYPYTVVADHGELLEAVERLVVQLMQEVEAEFPRLAANSAWQRFRAELSGTDPPPR